MTINFCSHSPWRLLCPHKTDVNNVSVRKWVLLAIIWTEYIDCDEVCKFSMRQRTSLPRRAQSLGITLQHLRIFTSKMFAAEFTKTKRTKSPIVVLVPGGRTQDVGIIYYILGNYVFFSHFITSSKSQISVTSSVDLTPRRDVWWIPLGRDEWPHSINHWSIISIPVFHSFP